MDGESVTSPVEMFLSLDLCYTCFYSLIFLLKIYFFHHKDTKTENVTIKFAIEDISWIFALT